MLAFRSAVSALVTAANASTRVMLLEPHVVGPGMIYDWLSRTTQRNPRCPVELRTL